jgi:POT family proton-dependent oligopeptide transporter
MSRTPYRSTPDQTPHMPPGIPYIVGNEAAERFSFYGMKGILVVFMTSYLMGLDGQRDVMEETTALKFYHLFGFANYFFPIIGAIVADVFLGKYRTIISLSIVYCLGHLALALDETRLGLTIGLTLIAIGSGGIKPCVSAHVGDQFGQANAHLLEKVFGWFYFSINFGSAISTFLITILLKMEGGGPRLAFGVPGALMLLATWVFWLGRRRYIHVPPRGKEFFREAFSPLGRRITLRLAGLYVFVAMFWALYDQTGSSWVLQAQNMDRRVLEWKWGDKVHVWTLEAAQVQTVNPILIMLFIPLFTYVIYPVAGSFVRLTAMKKIGAGLFMTAISFCIPAIVETWIVAGATPSYWWQVLSYVVITAAEVLVSITCLEFSYSQSPRSMKSFIMSLYLMSVALGNLFTSTINALIEKTRLASYLQGPNYYWFFAGLMLATAVVFVFYSRTVKEQRILQDD